MTSNTKALQEEFDELGYVCLRVQNDEALALIERDLSALISFKLEQHEIAPARTIFHDGFIELDRINHENIVDIYRTMERIESVAFYLSSPAIRNSVEALLSAGERSPVFRSYAVVRMDPPNDSTYRLDWHQESYSTIPDCPSLQLWGPLIGPSCLENGAISVLEGSHKCGEIQHQIKSNEEYSYCYVPEADVPREQFAEKVIELVPGEVILFHPNLLHCSGSNISEDVRYSLTAHYLRTNHRAFKPMDSAQIGEKNRQRIIGGITGD